MDWLTSTLTRTGTIEADTEAEQPTTPNIPIISRQTRKGALKRKQEEEIEKKRTDRQIFTESDDESDSEKAMNTRAKFNKARQKMGAKNLSDDIKQQTGELDENAVQTMIDGQAVQQGVRRKVVEGSTRVVAGGKKSRKKRRKPKKGKSKKRKRKMPSRRRKQKKRRKTKRN
tara:strand:+ start:260 stop:775 length:516 start_codon:yes stop_codon:yes gene_type:complete